MKRSKLLLVFTIILGLIACLLSVPVLSGENPWDADGGNGGGTGSPLDSVLNDAGFIQSAPADETPIDPDDDIPGWLSQTTTKVSSFILSYYYRLTSGPALRHKYGY